MNDLVVAETPILIQRIESYLAGEIDHIAIREFAWGFTDRSPEKPPPDEELFWSCMFTIIHLADAEHWREGCTQRDLSLFLKLLRERKPITDECEIQKGEQDGGEEPTTRSESKCSS